MTLALKMRLRTGQALGYDLEDRVYAFTKAVEQAQRQASVTALKKSRSLIPRTRPLAGPRPGRNHERIGRVLTWRPNSTGGVALNLDQLNRRAPHWIIQEIGTGESAVMRTGGTANPKGRPVKGATYVRTVKPQAGRRISSGLVFATGPRGQWSRPGSATGQQLFLRRFVQGVPATRTRSQPGIIIRNEIEGRHFVKEGAISGYREYKQSVLAAARSQFERKAP